MKAKRRAILAAFLVLAVAVVGALGLEGRLVLPGGARGAMQERRQVNPDDFSLPEGYSLELVAGELTYPTAITFDEEGQLYLVEAGFSYGPAKGVARILRIGEDGSKTEVASGFEGPLTGITYRGGNFYVADGGHPGRIWRVSRDGQKQEVVGNLPSGGDHYTGDVLFGPDGKLYFGLGTVTNSAVVGLDNFLQGWLGRFPQFHDIPTRDLTLAGVNFLSADPFSKSPVKPATTGAFVPFRTNTTARQQVKAGRIGNGAIYRVNPDGGGLELFADGLRNPFGMRFSRDGKLYVVNEGFDDRGSRPIANDWDSFWEVRQGGWYGWPDFASGMPVTDARFKPEGKSQPGFVLAEHPSLAGQPLARFDPHAGAMKFDFSRADEFGFVGEAFVALFGDLAPVTGMPTDSPGYRVVRLNLESGQVSDFLVNKKPGPEGEGPERPVAAMFSPDGQFLYVVDFGVVETGQGVIIPKAQSGALWRVEKGAGSAFAREPTRPRPRPARAGRMESPAARMSTRMGLIIGGLVLLGAVLLAARFARRRKAT